MDHPEPVHWEHDGVRPGPHHTRQAFLPNLEGGSEAFRPQALRSMENTPTRKKVNLM
ncbi:hypothetical protein JMJ77_0010287, partial [Colletotrichum scovillei]